MYPVWNKCIKGYTSVSRATYVYSGRMFLPLLFKMFIRSKQRVLYIMFIHVLYIMKSYLHCKKSWRKTSLTGCNTVYLRQYSVLFTFVSTLFTFASTVFFFVSTVLNFVSTVFFFKSYVTIAPPHPPASIHVYLHYSGRGRGSPATNQPPPPEYMLTQHSYKETSPPL